MATLTLSRMRNQTTDGVKDELRGERSIGGRSGEALVISTHNSRSQSDRGIKIGDCDHIEVGGLSHRRGQASC